MKDCPGLYCGRIELAFNNFTCGACPRGTRTLDADACVPCTNEPTFYDWLFLTFMAVLPLFYHWYYIDYKISNTILRRKLILSAIIETVLSAVLTVLLMEPRWELKLHSCPIRSVSDWYTFMYNPAPDYGDYIYCTQEVVYPLYSMIFVFYILGVIFLLSIRPWFMDKKNVDFTAGIATLYAGLYLYPILALMHAICCGLIYYLFPYLVIIVSVISNAVHFALKLDQSMKFLLSDTVTSARNLFIVLIHWLCHAFGIIGITQMTEPYLHYPLLCLIPVPTFFYILTSRLTDPRKMQPE